MDHVANSLEAYAVFCAPREDGPIARGSHRGPPPTPAAARVSPVGWMIGGFYGVIFGALMLGVTAGVDARRALLVCPTLTAMLLATQALLLTRRRGRVAVRIAQGLTTPALALAAAGLGGLARLPG